MYICDYSFEPEFECIMQKSKRLCKLFALFVVFISLSAFAGGIENEKDLIKTANKLFEAGKYAECLDYYSTLVSNHPQNPIFSYKYGVCKLYATEDKVESLRYLGYATQKKDKVDPVAFFFYGKALQQNYEFDAAAKQFKIYQGLVKPKEAEASNVSHYIKQCYTAKERIYDFKKMDVVTKKSVGKDEFFRSYRLGSMKRNIIITPDEFLTNADKKSGDYSLIVHHPMNEVIYFSSYNKEGSVGGKDIFKIQKMPDGTFSEPVNLGPTVNTKMDEDYPYLHPNGMVLYFASKGRNGIGGYDIFKSVLDTATGIWGKAENVGFSINSPGDDLLYVSDMEENIAYFASDRGDKQGKITVYKIFPSKSNSPVIIVRGQVEIEGSRNHTAKVTVYNSEGEELSTYISQKSGTFVMTLDEAQTYTVGVTATGRGEAKSALKLPRNSEANMISKKFVLSGGRLILEEASELLATAESRSKLLKESAQLNVNQAEDVDFNTKIERPSSSPVELNDDFTSAEGGVNDAESKPGEDGSTTGNILSDAREELREIKESKEQVKKQIDATYLVANKKKIKTELLKDEIEELSEELEMVFTKEEKETIQRQLSQKETDLKANVASATAALQLAKSKERELAVKEKQEELSQIYVDAVQEANNSGNSSKAIAKLEKARDELDEVQEEIIRVKKEDGSAETFAKADEARKKVADLERNASVLEKDVEDIVQQQEELKKQISATRNKGLKEEFNLQIKELDDELADIKVERNVNQAKLEAAKSELEVYSSTQDVYDEVYAEADDPSLMPVSEDQKTTIQEEVVVQTISAKEALKESDPDYEPPVVSASEPEYISEVESVEENVIREEVRNEESILTEDVVQENPVDELESSAEEVAAEVTPGETVFSSDDEQSAVEAEYLEVISKAEDGRKELKLVQDEIVELNASISSEKNKGDKKALEVEMEELRKREAQLIDDLKGYVELAKEKEEELPKEIRKNQNDNVERIEALAAEVNVLEKEVEEVKMTSKQEELVQTELITLDLETASDEDIELLLSEYVLIKPFDVANELDDKEMNKWMEEIKTLDKKSAEYLIAANKEQVKFEGKGGEGESPKAKKIKDKALKKQFEKVELQGRVSQKKYTVAREDIEKDMLGFSDVNTDEFKEVAADLEEQMGILQVKRNQLNSEKEESNKIQLINEANDLEREIFAVQNKLRESIDSIKNEAVLIAEQKAKEEADKEVELPEETIEAVEVEVAEKEEELPEETNEVVEVEGAEKEEELPVVVEVVPTELSTESETESVDLVSDKTEEEDVAEDITGEIIRAEDPAETVFYDKENPSQEAVEYGNKEGYGIIRDEDFAYTRSENVIQSMEAAKQEEKIALDYYYKADSLREEAEQNPGRAKKLNKAAGKLIVKGSKAQDKASKKYRELNENELAFNKKEVDFAVQYNEIVKVDSAKILLAKADGLFEKAENIRKEAAKQKSIQQKGALINEAYNMELEAIEVQNYILSGELDVTSSEVEEVVVVREVQPKEENEYTLKADDLLARADEESDPYKRRALFEEARAYELAGDKKRTQRLMDGLVDDHVDFENNAKIVVVSRKQSHKNDVANEAWAYEKQSESLFSEARVLKEKAANNTNDVEKLEQIAESNEILEEAKGVQARAIQKYQESRSVPDLEDFVVDFETSSDVAAGKKEDKEDEIAVFAQIEKTVKAEPEVVEDVEEVVLNTVDTEPEPSAEEEVLVSEVSYETTQESKEVNIEETEAEPVQKITEIKIGGEDESAEEAYKTLIAEANEAEANEVSRVEEIFKLNDLAEKNRNKSETALAEVDALSDEQAVTAKIAEANKYRELAEEYEVEAKSQQMILKNNVAEARSKKKEADLILVGIDESKHAELLSKVASDNSDLKKVQDYVASEVDINSTEDVPSVNDDTPVTAGQRINEEVDAENTPEILAETSDEVVVEEVAVVEDPEPPVIKDNVRKDDEFEFDSPELVEIDMDNVALLNESGAINDIPEEFSLDSEKMYPSTTSIPVDPPMPKGLIYQVQVGAFRQKIDPGIFNGLSPLVGEQISSGITRYKVGYFRGFISANIAKGRIRQLGYKDAFVVVFYNGKRITVDKAEEVITAADESEQFVYKNLVKDEVEQLKSLGITSEQDDELSAASVAPVEADNQTVVSGTSKEVIPTEENGLSNDLLKINGLFYTVQVGVYKTPRGSNDLFGLSPLYTEKTSNGYLRYTTGMFQDYNSADRRKNTVRNQGVRDAFVTAYKDNQRISVAQARQEEGNDNNASANSGSNKQGDSSSDNAEVVFKVQVGAYRTPITVETTPVFKDLTNYEVSNLRTSSGLLIYMVGSYKTKEEADNLRQMVVNYGGKDCFVVALVNGKRIPITRALEMVK